MRRSGQRTMLRRTRHRRQRRLRRRNRMNDTPSAKLTQYEEGCGRQFNGNPVSTATPRVVDEIARRPQSCCEGESRQGRCTMKPEPSALRTSQRALALPKVKLEASTIRMKLLNDGLTKKLGPTSAQQTARVFGRYWPIFQSILNPDFVLEYLVSD
jgi:hypothetical protein